jgi:hypothetical protein
MLIGSLRVPLTDKASGAPKTHKSVWTYSFRNQDGYPRIAQYTQHNTNSTTSFRNINSIRKHPIRHVLFTALAHLNLAQPQLRSIPKDSKFHGLSYGATVLEVNGYGADGFRLCEALRHMIYAVDPLLAPRRSAE